MYEALFEPVQAGTLKLANRFVMPAMNSNLGDTEHCANERAAEYYAERARGGFGLLITEFICVGEEGLAGRNQLAIYDDRFITGLKLIVDRVHENGGRIFAQLQHSGRRREAFISPLPAVGASAVRDKGYPEPVHELLPEEIPGIEQEFIDAAVRAKKAGFDGVEIHGAHGYLLAQFLSKSVNKRTDAYGGTISKRARIVCEIIRGVKEACGADYPVCVRTSGEEGFEGGNTIEDAAAQAMLMEEAGADLLNVSYGTAIQSYYTDSGFNIEAVKKVKQVVSIPVIGIGRINDPALMLYALKSGSMDMVALGRESITDPHIPEKIRENRMDEIMTCTGCIQRCLIPSFFEEEGGISCMINPFSGKESIWKIVPAETKKRIAVVGAGPAGLEASWILAKRGHDVTLYEKEHVSGGAYRLACIPSMKQELGNTIAVYEVLCRKYGVHMCFDTEATPELLQKGNYDEIVIAAGALPVIPRSIPGIDGENVYLAQDVLRYDRTFTDKKVLVLGAGLVGTETAEILGSHGNKVTIVDMLDKAAPLASPRPRAGLLERLAAYGTQYQLNSKVLRINKDGIDYECAGRQETLTGFDAVILAFGSRSDRTLTDRMGADVHLIGDAAKAGDAKKAIYEAAKLALSL